MPYNQFKAFYGSPGNPSSKSNSNSDTKQTSDKKRKRNEILWKISFFRVYMPVPSGMNL